MAPGPNTAENGSAANGVPADTSDYPPVAPIPAIRTKRTPSLGKKMKAGADGTVTKEAKCPIKFVRPDLPSRCTWTAKADPKTSPHTLDKV